MTTMNNQARTTPFQLAALLAPLLIALILIFSGLYFWSNPIPEVTQENAGLITLAGLLVLSLSTYWLIQTRKRMLKILTTEPPKMTTTLQCTKCGVKNIRDFQRGDYIYKQTDEACPNDKEKMTISAIFHEIKEKPKEANYI
jgi:hypothetical protein